MKHSGYSYHEIAEITQGDILQSGGHFVYQIVTDSRHLNQTEGALFAAIKGDRHNGHRYLSEVYQQGVRCFLVSENIDLDEFPGATFIQVENTLRAMQLIAAHHRSRFSIPVVGITGSNGKTVVKEWLNLLLADDFVIARSPRSYNSQIGVALSVMTLEPSHTLGIFEAGISEPGEMQWLEPMIRPTIGVLTTIGSAHIEHFSGSAEIASEKCLLFTSCSKIIYPADQKDPANVLENPPFETIEKFTWGNAAEADVRIGSITRNTADTLINLIWQNQHYTFSVPFIDSASIENVITCFTTLVALGIDAREVVDKMVRLETVSMRMEILAGIEGSVIINDSWSSDLESLRIALDVANVNAQKRPLTVILSDIPQTGMSTAALYDRVHQLIQGHGVKRMIGIGPNIHSARHIFDLPALFYPDTDAFLREATTKSFAGQAILVKGARVFQFERIVHELEEKSHETVLEINLGSLSNNLNAFRSMLHPSTRIMVMVKAFGYGSGSKEVSGLLEFNKVDYLAVAYVDEGIALRQAGISLPIMVMNPGSGSLSVMLRHRLEPEIYSFRMLRQLITALGQSGITNPYPIHLEIDTGMHRLGFLNAEIIELLTELERAPQLQIASVFTHLAASERPEHDSFTHSQLAQFTHICSQISMRRKESYLRHALNTGGIERFPEYQLDMVRLGVGLYGVSSSSTSAHLLQPVMRLRTLISQIKTIHAGDSVGYGRSFIASDTMRIGIIPLGYADGVRRVLSNGAGKMSVRGQRAPVVGRVCMDMTMIDLTHIRCEEGDEVEVFGHDITLDEFSKWNETIAYEILTTVGQRVRRVYTSE